MGKEVGPSLVFRSQIGTPAGSLEWPRGVNGLDQTAKWVHTLTAAQHREESRTHSPCCSRKSDVTSMWLQVCVEKNHCLKWPFCGAIFITFEGGHEDDKAAGSNHEREDLHCKYPERTYRGKMQHNNINNNDRNNNKIKHRHLWAQLKICSFINSHKVSVLYSFKEAITSETLLVVVVLCLEPFKWWTHTHTKRFTTMMEPLELNRHLH